MVAAAFRDALELGEGVAVAGVPLCLDDLPSDTSRSILSGSSPRLSKILFLLASGGEAISDLILDFGPAGLPALFFAAFGVFVTTGFTSCFEPKT